MGAQIPHFRTSTRGRRFPAGRGKDNKGIKCAQCDQIFPDLSYMGSKEPPYLCEDCARDVYENHQGMSQARWENERQEMINAKRAATIAQRKAWEQRMAEEISREREERRKRRAENIRKMGEEE